MLRSPVPKNVQLARLDVDPEQPARGVPARPLAEQCARPDGDSTVMGEGMAEMSDARFTGKRALVTGAASGIGEATVAARCTRRARTSCWRTSRRERLDALDGGLGDRVESLVLDVRDEREVAPSIA